METTERERRASRRWIAVFALGVAALMGGVLARLVFLHLLVGPPEDAPNYYASRPLLGLRGRILDRNGAVLAESLPGRVIYIDQKDPKLEAPGVDRASLPLDLARLLGLSEERLLDAFFDSQSYDSILINNVQGAYHATNFLISQCRCQPGYLHSSFPISNFEERANGFYNSIRYNGMSASKSIVHKLTPSQEGAYSDMKAIIESGEELATAYFADNDLIAVGAMRALISAGYRIPEDISIVGFDDLPLCEYVTPPLTTIHVPKQYMGEKAAERLLELINTKDHYPIKIEINTQLKERSSVRLRGRQ